MTDRPISKEHLAWAGRMTARRIAAAIVSGIAETDCDFATAAKRLAKSEQEIRTQLYALIDGVGDQPIGDIAELAFAFGFALQPKIQRVELRPLAEEEQSKAACRP